MPRLLPIRDFNSRGEFLRNKPRVKFLSGDIGIYVHPNVVSFKAMTEDESVLPLLGSYVIIPLCVRKMSLVKVIEPL